MREPACTLYPLNGKQKNQFMAVRGAFLFCVNILLV